MKIVIRVVFVLSIAIRLFCAFYMGDVATPLPGIFDQVSYHTLAVRVLEGNGFTFAQEWWPATPAGQPTAHWSYLYVAYLIIVYAIFGVHPLIARILQVVLVGILMPWLTMRIANKVFRGGLAQWVGITAAAWTAFYGYFIYYSAALMTESFYITGILWVMDIALRIAETGNKNGIDYIQISWWKKYRQWMELGLAIAITAMLRQVFLVFVPFLFLWLFWKASGQSKFRSAFKSIVTGGLVSMVVIGTLIAPISIHNYQKFGRFVLLNTNAGFAFFWANHPVHGDTFKPLYTEDMPSYQDVIPAELKNLNEAELEKALLNQGMKYVTADFGRYLVLCITRIPAHFIFWPLQTSSLISNIVRVASFGIAFPFMLVGIFRYIHENRRRLGWTGLSREAGSLLILFILVYVGVHLASWAGIRYRLPTDAIGLIFAAEALVAVANWLYRKRKPKVGLCTF